jgi:hypothetical protein
MRKAINAALGGDLIRGFRRPACSHRVRLLPGKLDRGTVNYGLRSTTHEPLYDINPMVGVGGRADRPAGAPRATKRIGSPTNDNALDVRIIWAVSIRYQRQ